MKNKINFKKIENVFNKLKMFLIVKPLLTIFLFFLLSILIALLIFYCYIFVLPQKNINLNLEAIIVNRNEYNSIFSRLNERLERLEEKNEYDLFSPVLKNKEELVEKDYFEENKENQIVMEDELESVLTQTLFDFYEINRNGMPLISERALIWEKFELGSADEYRGDYNQNINLLRVLKKEIEKNVD